MYIELVFNIKDILIFIGIYSELLEGISGLLRAGSSKDSNIT
jgi:hypothetical protein